ncbi:VWA domain-containing protein [Neolewinella aurantiaca]|uniref:VWA domain-containing protein n=1 Tax=Neolewinella aurantiaca TaxID=2602767 RepID=A0A5C7G0G8_9BACT|nr:carboxypeptidase-like regulatory domain-containing protein [Neolewinella aurantiaca]TXF91653.1 VWA domain-containing protein [Neolewinella aurantiaca]
MRSLLTLLFISALCTCALAQKTISGCVVGEDNEQLIGVSVYVNGSADGAATGLDGCFSFEQRGDSVALKLTYVGYVTQYAVAYANKPLTIKMKLSHDLLDEVVVIGYGESRRESPSRKTRSAAAPSTTADYAPVASPDTYEVTYERVDGTSDLAAASTPDISAGQLTAGETNDFGKWELWTDISKEDLSEFRDIWQFYPDNRYATQLTFPNGHPAVDVPVRLVNRWGQTIWSARTDNRGRAELWAGMTGDSLTPASQLTLVAEASGKTYSIPGAQLFQDGLNTLELPRQCNQRTEVDIAFVVDATGSMGDEIRYLSSELTDVINRAQANLPGAELRTSAVFYRDSSDVYVTIHSDFTEKPEATVGYVKSQAHGGGGDHPEAVDAALQTAVDSLAWREEAAARLLFLVLDAPPHQDETSRKRLHETTRQAAEKGIRIIPVVCSGMTKDGEYLLRSVALATNGTYVFLTDDSGIGGKHLAPTTDSYEVEKLNDLMVRVIGQFSETESCDDPTDLSSLEENVRKKGDLRLKAFPNPTPGPVTVKLPRSEGLLSVIDLNGKLLQQLEVTGRRQELQLGGLAAGTYILRYEDGEESRVVRIVLTR